MPDLRPAAPDDSLADQAMRRRIAAQLFGEPHPPVALGRFVIVETLGRGGMGVVYAAEDPRLGRVVALKVIRDRAHASAAERAALLREARALARLSHPNVVPVFEVGETEDGVFIAMERIVGVTLAEWLAPRRRRLAELLDVFTQAARGLAAAHAVGLVHRDFKPGNVLVGDDGRVRIVDFGLARASSGDTTLHPRDKLASPDSPDAATSPDSRPGTPAYMSPEQALGGEVDARSDVFSFCVALFEAIHGRRPYSPVELVDAAVPAPQRPPGGRRIPLWLHRLLSRGLALDRERRFADMRAVVDALTSGPRRRRVALAGLALAGLGALASSAPTLGSPSPCADVGVVAVWDVEARDALAERLAASERPFVALGARALAALDAYRDDLAAARVEACAATTLRGERSPELLDRAMACLDRRERSLAGVVELLRAADPAVIAAADAIVAALPPIAECDDRERLLAAAPQPDPRLADARADLERAELLRLARRPAAALPRIAGALALAAERGDHALAAEALLLRGRIEGHVLGDMSSASSTLHAAWDAALAAGDLGLAPAILGELGFVSAHADARTELARTWLGHARAALQGREEPRLVADLLAVEGVILRAEGRAAEAEARADEELALRAEVLPLDHPERIDVAIRRAHALADRDPDAARVALERLRGAAGARLGADHPALALIDVSLAQLLAERDEPARAGEVAARAQAVLADIYGPDHPAAARADLILAAAEAAEGSLDAAVARVERARRALEREYPRGAPTTIAALALLAELHRVRGGDHDALAALQALLAAQEALGVDHDRNGVMINIGEYLCRLGRCAEARPLFEQLLARLAAGDDAPALRAFPLRGLAQLYRERGEPAAALPLLEEALVLLDADPELSPATVAEVLRALSDCLGALGLSPTRARALVRRAEAIERGLAPGE